MPDRLKLFMVYHEDKPIGGSLMFYPNEIVALCFYNMLLYDYEKYKPIQRVIFPGLGLILLHLIYNEVYN